MIVKFKILNLPDIYQNKDLFVKWNFNNDDIIDLIKPIDELVEYNYTKAGVYTITANIIGDGCNIEKQIKIKVPNYIIPPVIEGDNDLTIEKSKEPVNLILTAKFLGELLEGEEITKYEWESDFPNYETATGNELQIPINLDTGTYTYTFRCRVYDNIGNISDWSYYIVNIKIIEITGAVSINVTNLDATYNNSYITEEDNELIESNISLNNTPDYDGGIPY